MGSFGNGDAGQPSRRTLVQGIGMLAGATVLAAPAVAAAEPLRAFGENAPDTAVVPDEPFAVTPGLTYLNFSMYDFAPTTGTTIETSVSGAYAPDADTQFTVGVPVPSGSIIRELTIGARNSGISTRTYTLYRIPHDASTVTTVASTTLTPGTAAVRTSTVTANHFVNGDAAYVLFVPTLAAATVRIFSGRVGYTTPTTPGTFHPLPVPVRIYDSRPGTLPPPGPKTKFANHEERVLNAKLGTGVLAASSVLLNIAATNTNPGGFFSLFKNGVAWPNTSTLNWGVANTTVSTLSATAIAADGTFRARCEGAGGADLIVDVVGWFT